MLIVFRVVIFGAPGQCRLPVAFPSLGFSSHMKSATEALHPIDWPLLPRRTGDLAVAQQYSFGDEKHHCTVVFVGLHNGVLLEVLSHCRLKPTHSCCRKPRSNAWYVPILSIKEEQTNNIKQQKQLTASLYVYPSCPHHSDPPLAEILDEEEAVITVMIALIVPGMMSICATKKTKASR